MRFITYHVKLTDEAMGATWTVDHTYHYSNRDLDKTNLPDLEKKFGREVMHSFAHHIGFFGRTITVSPVQTSYESRQPTIEEAKAMRGYNMLRLVEKDDNGVPIEPTPFFLPKTAQQRGLE